MPESIAPNTHNLAAQASAARIVKILQKDFFQGQTAALGQDEINYLNKVLDWAINGGEGAQPKGGHYPHIEGIVNFIQTVLTHSEEPFSDKKQQQAVFSEIKRQLMLGSDHWTQNTFYDEKGEKHILDTSLGEALNLTCLGLFSRGKAYAALNQNSREDILNRQLSLFKCLEALSRDGKCTGGRQHDILYLLNGVYPVATPKGFEPVLLIEDINDFIYQCVSNAVADNMRHNKRWGCALQWLRYQAGDDTEPNLDWFNEIQKQVIESVKNDLRSYAINPDDQDNQAINRYINQLCDAIIELTVPDAIHPNIIWIKGLLQCKDDRQPGPRNTALTTLKASIRDAQNFDSINAQQIKDFLEMEEWYQAIRKDQQITLFIGQEATNFFKKIVPEFKAQLDAFFSNDSKFNKTNYEACKAKYVEAQRSLREAYHTTTVENFFVLLKNDGKYDTLLHSLAASPEEQRRFMISEDDIRSWIERINNAAANGESVDITPYELNRLLIDLCIRVDNKAPIPADHRKALLIVVNYLSCRDNPGPRILDFKKSYSSSFLAKVCLVAALPPHMTITDLVPTLPSFYIDYDTLLGWKSVVDTLARIISNATDENRTKILDALENHLSTIIHDGDVLQTLFLLPLAKLTSQQRTDILNAIQNQFDKIIQHPVQLRRLLHLSPDQLNAEQRSFILNKIGEQLIKIIPNGDELFELFLLTSNELNEQQRSFIFNIIKNKLGNMIQRGEQLEKLFSLSSDQLNAQQRTDIWAVVQNQIGNMIQNGYELGALFRLNSDKLNEEQRADLWIAVQNRIGDIIQDGAQLCSLLHLPPYQLNAQQRTTIWAAVQNKLGTIIQNGRQLSSLLGMPITHLALEQRAEIWSAVRNNFKNIIQNSFVLETLFRLTDEQLTPEQREDILKAVKSNFENNIKTNFNLENFFRLSTAQLTPQQRTEILIALQNTLGTIIKDGYNLCELFKLSPEQLNAEQRTLILISIKDQLGTMMKPDGVGLNHLFSLSTEHLNAQQRSLIWMGIQNNLGNFFGSSNVIREFFNLSSEQLNQEQRLDILRSLPPAQQDRALDTRLSDAQALKLSPFEKVFLQFEQLHRNCTRPDSYSPATIEAGLNNLIRQLTVLQSQHQSQGVPESTQDAYLHDMAQCCKTLFQTFSADEHIKNAPVRESILKLHKQLTTTLETLCQPADSTTSEHTSKGGKRPGSP